MQLLKTIQVYGPAGAIIINESDLPDFEAKGYSRTPPAGGSIPSTQPPGVGAAEPPSLDKLTLPQLRAKAADAGIENAAKLNRAELLMALKEK